MKNKPTLTENLNNQYRKMLLFTGASLVVVLSALVALLVFLSQKPEEKVQAKVPTIALVNEDVPSTFNKQNYNFGKKFVELSLNDNRRRQ